ncbi:hypothetical protein [Aeromicrobium sp. UC242_57]|uniref:hypothetical protein n=1 Tax=Aeromicrobium sp. UC242_57 TaxID=3374624 RepID=UPI0037A2DDF4
MVAGRGNLIYRMDQFGTVLNSIDPPNLQSSAGETLGGRPTRLAVSPDGSKIAYTYSRYSCPVGAACRVRWVTAFTKATALLAQHLGRDVLRPSVLGHEPAGPGQQLARAAHPIVRPRTWGPVLVRRERLHL